MAMGAILHTQYVTCSLYRPTPYTVPTLRFPEASHPDCHFLPLSPPTWPRPM